MNIGPIHIEQPLLLAPMEDVTDQPFRLICKELGADIVYTEFVNSEGLRRSSEKTKLKMQFTEKERPFGIQLYGGNPESMHIAAAIATELNPDFIDINCGCWVKNVVNNGAGSDLLRDLPRMEKIIRNVIAATHLPVTVKTRLGWDANTINILDIATMVEQAGATALTVHCRTRAQAHKGEPDYSWLPRIKQTVSIPVIANGSLDSPQKIKSIFTETGCDGVMIGRAAIENPWIFREARTYLLTGKELPPPTIEERFSILIRHLQFSIEHKGEKKGVIEFRKHYTGYLKGLAYAARIRQKLMEYVEFSPVYDVLLAYKEQLLEKQEQVLTESR